MNPTLGQRAQTVIDGLDCGCTIGEVRADAEALAADLRLCKVDGAAVPDDTRE